MPFGVLRALTNFKPVDVKIGMRMTGNSAGAAAAASERSPIPGRGINLFRGLEREFRAPEFRAILGDGSVPSPRVRGEG